MKCDAIGTVIISNQNVRVFSFDSGNVQVVLGDGPIATTIRLNNDAADRLGMLLRGASANGRAAR